MPTFTDMKGAGEAAVTFDLQNPICPSSSGCLCQIRRKSLKVFLGYHVHMNGVRSPDLKPENIMPPGSGCRWCRCIKISAASNVAMLAAPNVRILKCS